MERISVRTFCGDDKEAVRQISYDTSFAERPQEFIDDKDTVADVLTLYFTEYEPGSCLVAVKGETVVGYLIGTKNAWRMNCIFAIKILPRLLWRACQKGVLWRKKERQLIQHFMISVFKKEFFAPNFLTHYPAVLHINIHQNCRGQKIGSQLISRFMDSLKEKNIKGVHVSTMSEKAKEFFMSMGFDVLYRSKRSWLKYRLGYEVPFYILGKAASRNH
jgi:N-acetylglutamate synthase-like GNAT family acetyltransferase